MPAVHDPGGLPRRLTSVPHRPVDASTRFLRMPVEGAHLPRGMRAPYTVG